MRGRVRFAVVAALFVLACLQVVPASALQLWHTNRNLDGKYSSVKLWYHNGYQNNPDADPGQPWAWTYSGYATPLSITWCYSDGRKIWGTNPNGAYGSWLHVCYNGKWYWASDDWNGYDSWSYSSVRYCGAALHGNAWNASFADNWERQTTRRPVLGMGVADPGGACAASKVRVQVARDAGFTQLVRDVTYGVWANPYNGSWTVDTDLADGTYYWRVRGGMDWYGHTDWSGWTGAWAFVVDAAPPAPTGLVPTRQHRSVRLNWNPVTAADLAGYDVYKGDAVRWSYSKVNSATVTSTTLTADDLAWAHTYRFYVVAKDAAGNVAASAVVTSTPADLVAPVTGSDAVVSYLESATITVSATDDYSGVASTLLRLDGGPWSQGTVVTVDTPGAHTLEFSSRDLAGNAETTKVATFTVAPPLPPDTEPPVTTAWPSRPFGVWGNTDVEVVLTATDAGSGVASTWYTVNGGLPVLYVGQFSVAAEGTVRVDYWSVDGLGNAEWAHSAYARVDRTCPAVGSDALPSYEGTACIAVTASDALAGVALQEWRLDGAGAWVQGVSAVATGAGFHTLEFRATDGAGNTATGSALFEILPGSDTEAPATNVCVTPPIPDGVDDWYVTRPSLAMSSTEQGATYYQWDSTSTVGWTRYTAPVAAPEGQHTIIYFSVDSAGNTETVNQRAFKVDTVKPPVPSTWPGTEGTTVEELIELFVNTGWFSDMDRYELEYASTAAPSDATVWYVYPAATFGGSHKLNATWLSPGDYAVRATNVDRAGNRSSRSTTFTVLLGGTASWQRRDVPLAVFDDLQFSPAHATDGAVYGAFGDGMAVSTDHGMTWTDVYSRTTGPDVKRLLFSPEFGSDATVFAEGYSQILRSYDGGASWRAVKIIGTDLRPGRAISPEFATDRTVLLGGYLSTDGGDTWRRLPVGMVESAEFSPDYAADQTIFLGSYSEGLLRSTDGGATWIALGAGLPTSPVPVTDIAVSPAYAADHTVYIALYGGDGRGVYKSTDCGATWARVYTPAGGMPMSVEIAPDYSSSQTLFACDEGNGLYRSTDAGSTWQSIRDGGYTSLRIAPDYAVSGEAMAQPRTWYKPEPPVFSANGGTSWSTRTGARSSSWQVVSTPLYGNPCMQVMVGNGNGVFLSADGMSTWSRVRPGSTGLYGIAISPNFGDGQAFVSESGGVFQTWDWGSEWSTVTASDTGKVWLPSDYTAVGEGFRDSSTGLKRTVNNGTTWSHLATETFTDLAFSPAFTTDRTALAVSSGNIRRSVDGGATWQTVLSGQGIQQVVLSPEFDSDGTAFARVLEADRIGYVTRDHGQTWTAMPSGPPRWATAMAFSPDYASDGALLVASGNAGVQYTSDFGVTWHGVTIRGLGGGATGISAPMAVVSSGEHTITIIGGNGYSLTLSLPAETGPPVTEAVVEPAGWTSGDVTLTLVATDALSGVAATYVSVGEGAPELYLGPRAFSAESTAVVTYWSVDNVGNVESGKTVQLMIDRTPPVTTEDHVATYVDGAWIRFEATDALSGHAHFWTRQDSGSWVDQGPIGSGCSLVIPEPGAHTIEYYSVDAAGNVEGTHSISFTVEQSGAPPGSTWTTSTIGFDYTLSDVWFVSQTEGWATGWNSGGHGLLFRSSDGGETWSCAYSSVSVALHAVEFADQQHGWIAGETGKIVHTEDGGSSWATQTVPLSGTVYDLSFVDSSVGWAIADDGVAHTADGGSTWTTLPAGFGGYGIDFASVTHGVAVGASGWAWRTSDGGVTWTGEEIAPGWTGATQDVCMLTESVGYAVGDLSAIWRTDDGGATWSSHTGQFAASDDLRAVSVVGTATAWAVGAYPQVVSTVDGSTWATESAPGWNWAMRGVHFVDASHGWAVGDLGQVWRYVTTFTPPATDTIAPVTSIGCEAVRTDGIPDGWKSGVSLSFTSTDTGGSDVAGTYYALDGGAPVLYSVPFAVTGDGTRTVTYWSADMAGNIESTQTHVVKIDDTPPSTGDDHVASYVGSATITLIPVDPNSGVDLTMWRLDGAAEWTTGTVVATSEVGSHTLEYYSVDALGHTEMVRSAQFVVVPVAVPHTTALVDGVIGEGGWYVTTPTVTLDCDRPEALVQWRLDDIAEWSDYAGPVEIPAGTHTLWYRGVMPDGNTESANSLVVRTDLSVPEPVSPAIASMWETGCVVGWPATMDDGSGVAYYEVRRDGVLIATTTATSIQQPGLTPSVSYTYEVRAIDGVGRLGTCAAPVRFTVPSLVVGEPPTSQETSAGDDVVVELPGGGQLEFEHIDEPGVVVITPIDQKHGTDANFRIVREAYYDIHVDCEFTGTVLVTIPFDPTTVTGNPDQLKLFHWKDNGWEDVTISVDWVNHTITGRVDSFSDFMLAESTVGTTLYEQTELGIVWVGRWVTLARTNYSGGSVRYASGACSTATVAFTGTGIEWIGARTTSGGRADVYVDGVYNRTVDMYASPNRFGVVLATIGGLADGPHTLQIVTTGVKTRASTGYNTWVDAFRVSGTLLQ